MPIYEYKCHNCGEKFEVLTLTHSDNTIITCAKCGSESTERIMSCFASATGSNSKGTSSCSSSGNFS